MIEVQITSLQEAQFRTVPIVTIVLQDLGFTRRQGLDQAPRDGRFSRTGATGDAYDQRVHTLLHTMGVDFLPASI